MEGLYRREWWGGLLPVGLVSFEEEAKAPGRRLWREDHVTTAGWRQRSRETPALRHLDLGLHFIQVRLEGAAPERMVAAEGGGAEGHGAWQAPHSPCPPGARRKVGLKTGLNPTDTTLMRPPGPSRLSVSILQ